MDHRITLTNGRLFIKNYSSSLEVFINGEHGFTYSFDGDIEYTTEENIESFINDKLEDYIELTAADKAKLYDELKTLFYFHSSEIHHLGEKI